MRTPYYREQALEGIACEVITAYDPNLYYGVPRMIPIEDIIEAQGITLEYQCLRKTGCVLGETIFDDGGAIIYDYDIPGYTVIAVKSGTILIDSSLCREDASTGRLRFTCAHELAHWLLHKRLYSGTGESAAMMTETNIVRTQNSALEMQANLLGSILRTQSLHFGQQIFFHRLGQLLRPASTATASMLNCQAFRTFFQIDSFPVLYSFVPNFKSLCRFTISKFSFQHCFYHQLLEFWCVFLVWHSF